MSKYTVPEFVEAYKKTGTDVVKQQKLLKEINIKHYVPFNMKRVMAKKLVEDICLDENEIILNSPKRYLAYVLSIVTMYTDLECEQEDSSLDYDLLRESGILETIFLEIGDDIKEYKTMWTMCYEDLLQNENSLVKIIKRNVERFGFICNNGLLKTAEAINGFTSQDVKNIVKNIKDKAQEFVQDK